MAVSKKHAYIGKQCVACGVCVKACLFHAIKIHKGVKAVVEEAKCVGCGKCAKACPADVITIKEMAAE